MGLFKKKVSWSYGKSYHIPDDDHLMFHFKNCNKVKVSAGKKYWKDYDKIFFQYNSILVVKVRAEDLMKEWKKL